MAIQKQVACCRHVTVQGHEQLIIETAAGQRVTLQDGASSVLIEDSNGNSIHLENGKVTISSLARLVLQAPIVEINGSAVEVNAATVRCSGVMQADTVIANTVVAASYTPGAGNVW